MARERITNASRLQRGHGLADARGATRHGCDEPFALIVPAEEAIELRSVSRLADEKQQMTLLRLALQNGDIQFIAKTNRHAQFEELTVAVALDIHGVICRRGIPGAGSIRDLAHFKARADLGEPGLNLICIHKI